MDTVTVLNYLYIGYYETLSEYYQSLSSMLLNEIMRKQKLYEYP